MLGGWFAIVGLVAMLGPLFEVAREGLNVLEGDWVVLWRCVIVELLEAVHGLKVRKKLGGSEEATERSIALVSYFVYRGG